MPVRAGDINEVIGARAAAKESFGKPPSSINGTAMAAKVSAARFQRQNAPKVSPAPSAFQVEREQDPGRFELWGKQLATTAAGEQFMAPLPEPMEVV